MVNVDTHNLLWISAVVGFVLPQLIAVVNQEHWQAGIKSLTAFGICLAAAAITVWAKGDFDFTNVSASLAVVYALARTSYSGLWKPVGLADGVEKATTIKPRSASRATTPK